MQVRSCRHRCLESTHIHRNPPTSIHIHPNPPTSIHIHPNPPTFIHAHPHLSTSIHPSTSIDQGPNPASEPGRPEMAPGGHFQLQKGRFWPPCRPVPLWAQIRPPSLAGQKWVQRAIFNCKRAAFGLLAAQGRFGPKSGFPAMPAKNRSRGPFSIAKRTLSTHSTNLPHIPQAYRTFNKLLHIGQATYTFDKVAHIQQATDLKIN